VPGAVLPAYGGHCITAIPDMVCSLLGAPADAVPSDLLPAHLLEGVRTVVFILAD